MIRTLLLATLIAISAVLASQSVAYQEEDNRLILNADWLRDTSALEQYIPSYIQAIKSDRIQSLRLSFTYCKDPEYILNHFFSQTINVTSLSINLDTCKVADRGVAKILSKIEPYTIKELHLVLSSTGATQKVGKILGENIAQFQNLKALKIGLMMIKLGDKGLSNLFLNPLSHQVQDFSLDLTNCKLGVDAFQNFSSYVSKLSPQKVSKVQIIVRGNKLQSNSTMDIAKKLKKLKNIQTFKFDAYFNNLKSHGVKPIALLVKGLQKLKVLSLNFDLNYIENEGGKYVGDAIKDLEQLQYLQIGVSTKNFGYNGYNHILGGMMNLVNLKYLSFRCGVNRIGSKAAYDFKKLFEKVKNLEYLQLHLVQNLMYDEGLQILVQSISNLQKLKTFRLNFGFNELRKTGLLNVVSMLQKKRFENVWIGLSNNPIDDTQVAKALPHLKNILDSCVTFELEFLYTKISQQTMSTLTQLFERAKKQGRCNSTLHINSEEDIRKTKQQIERQDDIDRRKQEL